MIMAKLKVRKNPRTVKHIDRCRRARLLDAFRRPESLDGIILLAVLRATDGGVWIRRQKLVDIATEASGVSRAKSAFLINTMVRVKTFNIRNVPTGGRPAQELQRIFPEHPELQWLPRRDEP